MSTWDNNGIVVLECENNVTDNQGNYTFTNLNGVPYSNTVFKEGAYSLGPFDASAASNYCVHSNANITEAIKTCELFIRPFSNSLGNRWIVTVAGNPFVVQYENNGIRFYIAGVGWSSFTPVSVGTWYHFAWTFDGTYIKMYKDNALTYFLTSSYVPANAVWHFGNDGGHSVSCNCYLDNIVLSDIVRTSFPTIPTSDPTITDISPAAGSVSGGTEVTIAGAEFATGATVTFGGVSATEIVVVSATEITCVTPAGAAGAVDVVITNTDTGTVTEVDGFTYVVFGAKTIKMNNSIASKGSNSKKIIMNHSVAGGI